MAPMRATHSTPWGTASTEGSDSMKSTGAVRTITRQHRTSSPMRTKDVDTAASLAEYLD